MIYQLLYDVTSCTHCCNIVLWLAWRQSDSIDSIYYCCDCAVVGKAAVRHVM